MFKDRIEGVLEDLNSFNPDREQLFYEYVKARLDNDLKRYDRETTSTLNALASKRAYTVVKGMME